MKKQLLLTLAVGALGASQAMALDLFITGSTAFRVQAYNACTKMFNPAPTIVYDTGGLAGGSTDTTDGKNIVLTMSGTASNSITALAGGAFTIHANFTGSVQGMQTVESLTPILFLTSSTTPTLMTNTPTIAFSDVASSSTPYNSASTTSFSEDSVAVQPFVFVRSLAPNMAGVTNITWEQIKYLHQAGKTPLSMFTLNPLRDNPTNVYIFQRTQDSGTRRTTFAYVNAGFAEGITTYNYDYTNNVFYLATGTDFATHGGSNSIDGLYYAVIGGSPGYNGANLNWNPGYVGGSNIQTAIGDNNANNLSVAYLSVADAQKVDGGSEPSADYWQHVIPLNGVWPTAAGSGLIGNNGGTNDFTPISNGQYGLWAKEIVLYPKVSPNSLSSDQNLTTQLGKAASAGTILGVLDNVNPATAAGGSIDNEIKLTEPSGATAIRLSEMVSSRATVGGVIAP